MKKYIHYIWLGDNPKSQLIRKCISSWHKYLPTWEIKEWNETNLNLDINAYCRKAYDSGKYAFASDALRFYIISKYGGIYFDVDVELKRPIDDLFESYDCFCGFEYNGITVGPGLVLYASHPNQNFIMKMSDLYKNLSFDNTANKLPKTICEYSTEELVKCGLKTNDTLQTVDGVTVFPSTYFCPTNRNWSVQKFSGETRCIHHYNASWLSGSNSFWFFAQKFLFRIIGSKGIHYLKKARDILWKSSR